MIQAAPVTRNVAGVSVDQSTGKRDQQMKQTINGNEYDISPRASLCGANLCGADLCGANLCGADLRGASLCGANLRGAQNIPPLVEAETSIVAEGDIIGYKKLSLGVICKIKIPAGAKRGNATGRKCRAEYAIVLEGEGCSQYDSTFAYRVGETVRPREPFDDNRWEECASGIHFFLTRVEAENY